LAFFQQQPSPFHQKNIQMFYILRKCKTFRHKNPLIGRTPNYFRVQILKTKI
jgi:hypothetical protein